MFDKLYEAVCILLQQKSDADLTDDDHQFLTIVVNKAVSCDIPSKKLLSLLSKTLKPLDEKSNISSQCATLSK